MGKSTITATVQNVNTNEIQNLRRIQQYEHGRDNNETIVYHIRLRDTRFPGEPRRLVEDAPTPGSQTPLSVMEISTLSTTSSEELVNFNRLPVYSVVERHLRDVNNLPLYSDIPSINQSITTGQQATYFYDNVVSTFIVQEPDIVQNNSVVSISSQALNDHITNGMRTFRNNLLGENGVNNFSLQILERIRRNREISADVDTRAVDTQETNEFLSLIINGVENFFSLFSPISLASMLSWILDHPTYFFGFFIYLVHQFLFGYLNTAYATVHSAGSLRQSFVNILLRVTNNPFRFNIRAYSSNLQESIHSRFSQIVENSRIAGLRLRHNMTSALSFFSFNNIRRLVLIGVVTGGVFTGIVLVLNNAHFVGVVVPFLRPIILRIVRIFGEIPRGRVTPEGHAPNGGTVTVSPYSGAISAIIALVTTMFSLSQEQIDLLMSIIDHIVEELPEIL